VYDYAINKGLDTTTSANTPGRAATFFNATMAPRDKGHTYTPKGDEERAPLQKDLGLRATPCKFHMRNQCQFAYDNKLCPYSHKLAEQLRSTNDPATATGRSDRKCYSCGKMGHLKHQCRK
jgi:hypothetical protein